jgi:hypothetical protein
MPLYNKNSPNSCVRIKIHIQLSKDRLHPLLIHGESRRPKQVILSQPYIHVYISNCYLHVELFLSNSPMRHLHVELFLSNSPMRHDACVLPSSTNRQIKVSKMYTEAIQTPKDMEQPLHLTLQEGNQGWPLWHHKHTWIRSYVLHNWIHQTRKESCHVYHFLWQFFARTLISYQYTHQVLILCNNLLSTFK